MNQTKFCKICKNSNRPPRCPGFLIGWETLEECPYDHNTELETYNISGEDLLTICDISEESSFLESMIALKESDPIEFQLKMSQFKANIAQQESSNPTVECPYCHATNTKKISGMSKAGSVALFGIFAMGKVNKQWHCNNCNSDF